MYPQRKRDITIPSEKEENPHNVTLRRRGVSLRERGVLKFPQRERGIQTMYPQRKRNLCSVTSEKEVKIRIAILQRNLRSVTSEKEVKIRIAILQGVP